jgi:hypothetical protein
VTSAFVTRARAQEQQDGEDVVLQRLDRMSAELEAVRAELGRLQR